MNDLNTLDLAVLDTVTGGVHSGPPSSPFNPLAPHVPTPQIPGKPHKTEKRNPSGGLLAHS